MDALAFSFTLALHLFYFTAPALLLACLLALGGVILGKKSGASLSWIAQAAINSIVGCTVLLLGLWLTGSDGKMLTYTALVLVSASVQWVGCRR